MISLAELVQHFSDVGSLTKASPDELQSLRIEHTGIPPEYVQFLESAGHGNLGSISLYGGPVKAGEVYPDADRRLAEILLVGDDFQGYSFGFEPNGNWRIVEVGPGGEIDTSIESDFLSLLTGYMKSDLENDQVLQVRLCLTTSPLLRMHLHRTGIDRPERRFLIGCSRNRKDSSGTA